MAPKGSRIKTVNIAITATIGELEKQLSTASKKMQDFGRNLKTIGDGMTKMITLPVVAAGTALYALANKAGTMGSNLMTMSTSTGMSTDKLQELQYVAIQTGMDFNSITASLAKFTGSLRAAEKPASENAKILSALFGKSWDAEKLKSLNEIYLDTIRKVGDIKDETVQAEIANKLFGRGFQDLMPLVRASAADIETWKNEAHELGIVIPESELKNLTDLEHKLKTFQLLMQYKGMNFIERLEQNGTLTRLMNIFEKNLLPAIEKIIEFIGKIAHEFNKLSPANQEGLIKLVAVLAVGGPLLSGLGRVFELVGKIGIALLKLELPAGLITGLGQLGLVLAGITTAIATGTALNNSDVVTEATRYNLANNNPIPQGPATKPLMPGTPEYEKFKANWYATHPRTPEQIVPPSLLNRYLAVMTPKAGTTEIGTTGTGVTGASDYQALLDALSGASDVAKYTPTGKQEALKKLFDANQISLNKYYDALLELKTEMYKGYENKSVAKLQAELQSTDENVAKKTEGYLSLIKEISDVGKQMNDAENAASKQDALRKLLDANQISLEKYRDALLTLKAEIYKGFESKSAAKLQEELQSTDENISAKAEGYLSLIKEIMDVNKQMADDSASAFDKLSNSLSSFGDAVKQQTKSFADFVGIFDVLERKPISGIRLLNRLKGQLKAMGDWQGALARLQARGAPAQMLTEFQGMGVVGVENISALSKMNDAQLREYINLYNQKYSIAGAEALKQVTAERNIENNIEKQTNMYLNGIKIVPADEALYKGFTDFLKRKGIFAW